MRASIIALIFLVASPLMVFAAPSSQIGSLVVRDTPPGGKPLDNLDNLEPEELFKHIQGLTSEDAKDTVEKLSDNQVEKLALSHEDQIQSLIEKVGHNNKVVAYIERNQLRQGLH